MLKKAIVAAAVIGLLGSATPAAAYSHAAIACRSTSCDGLDPQRCQADGRTLASTEAGGHAFVELRYSPTCNAAWARIDNYRGVAGMAKVIGYVGGSLRGEQLKTLAAYPGENAWTNMLSFTYTVYACYRRSNSWGGWNEWCTEGRLP